MTYPRLMRSYTKLLRNNEKLAPKSGVGAPMFGVGAHLFSVRWSLIYDILFLKKIWKCLEDISGTFELRAMQWDQV